MSSCSLYLAGMIVWHIHQFPIEVRRKILFSNNKMSPQIQLLGYPGGFFPPCSRVCSYCGNDPALAVNANINVTEAQVINSHSSVLCQSMARRKGSPSSKQNSDDNQP